MIKLLKLPQTPGKDYNDEVGPSPLQKDSALNSPNIK